MWTALLRDKKRWNGDVLMEQYQINTRNSFLFDEVKTCQSQSGYSSFLFASSPLHLSVISRMSAIYREDVARS